MALHMHAKPGLQGAYPIGTPFQRPIGPLSGGLCRGRRTPVPQQRSDKPLRFRQLGLPAQHSARSRPPPCAVILPIRSEWATLSSHVPPCSHPLRADQRQAGTCCPGNPARACPPQPPPFTAPEPPPAAPAAPAAAPPPPPGSSATCPAQAPARRCRPARATAGSGQRPWRTPRRRPCRRQT